MTFYLVESRQGPDPGDEGVDEGGGHVPPLPPLLPGVGGRGGDKEVGDGVDQDEGDEPAPCHQPPEAALPIPRVLHGLPPHDPGIHMDILSTNCVLLDVLVLINFSALDFINVTKK